MTLEFLTQLGRKARPFRHGFRHESGAGEEHHDIPDRLLVKPPPLWAGNVAAGEALIRGAFTHHGQVYAFPDPFQSNIWMPPGMGTGWLAHLHSFTWLADLRAVSGEESIRAGFTLIDNWCRVMKSHTKAAGPFNPLAPGLMGERLSHWISHADIFVPEHDEAFRDLFFSQLEHQALTLHKTLTGRQAGGLAGLDVFRALKGLIYSGLALEGRETWIEQGLTLLLERLDIEILKDGGHISRSPGLLFAIFKVLLDIQTALAAGGYPTPDALTGAVEHAGAAIKFFRTGKGALAGFHQTPRLDPEHIDQALGQAGLSAKPFTSLPHTGFERLTLGKSVILFDSGTAPPPGFDGAVHAAPLAFEFFYGREALLVNCGSHPASPDWQAVLRSTPAHNTLTMDGRNAFEIKDQGGLGRKSRRAATRRMDGKDYQLAESSHDGYEGLNGFIHSRRLYLGNKGHDLRGEDNLESSIGKPLKTADFAIRFHLHPHCTASLIQGGREVLVRMPGGIGWRFFQEGAFLNLEDSIIIGPGYAPRKTMQIVLYGQASQAATQVKWALQREGI